MTTEMPPSAMVDVNVVTTFFDDTWLEVLLAAEVTVGLALDVSRVVLCDVAEAMEDVSILSEAQRCKPLAPAPTFHRIDGPGTTRPEGTRLKPGRCLQERPDNDVSWVMMVMSTYRVR